MEYLGIISIIFFASMLFLGVPISISLALSSLILLFSSLPLNEVLSLAASRMVNSINNPVLLAMPFFILSGNLMNKSGIAMRLVRFSKLIVGRWLPGYLTHTNIVGNMLFGSMSGLASASAATIGSIMYPIQEEEKYDAAYVTAVNVASAPTGALIPPSASFIVYALVAKDVDLSALFVAGYIPGILMGLTVMFVALIFAIKNNYTVDKSFSSKEILKIILDAAPSIILIFVIIFGIGFKFFTPIEASVIAACYSLILSLVYKSLTIKIMFEVFLKSAKMSAMVLFLISASSIMSYAITDFGIAQGINDLLFSITDNKYLILLMINIFLLFAGAFIDMSPSILMFTPIFLPIAEKIGINPVHFGVILIFNLAIGFITPPVGVVLFVGCSVSKAPIENVSKRLIPYFISLFIMLLIITYIPDISLFIPKAIELIK